MQPPIWFVASISWPMTSSCWFKQVWRVTWAGLLLSVAALCLPAEIQSQNWLQMGHGKPARQKTMLLRYSQQSCSCWTKDCFRSVMGRSQTCTCCTSNNSHRLALKKCIPWAQFSRGAVALRWVSTADVQQIQGRSWGADPALSQHA